MSFLDIRFIDGLTEISFNDLKQSAPLESAMLGFPSVQIWTRALRSSKDHEEQRALYIRTKQQENALPDRAGLNRERQHKKTRNNQVVFLVPEAR